MRSSRRTVITLLAIAFTCAVPVVLSAALSGLAAWAETTAYSYPYKEGEDPLRILLPSIVGGSGEKRILLTGPSAAGESLLYEEFERSFPGFRALSLAFSTATVDDILLCLDYIEQAYGATALPEAIVLGGEPRFFNNLPRRFGPTREEDPFSPLISLIDRYSPDFRVEDGDTRSVLAAKSLREASESTLRFWIAKQQARQRTAIAALLNQLLNGPGPNLDLTDDLPGLQSIADPFAPSTATPMLQFAASVGPYTAFREWLPAYASPYVFQYKGPARDVEPNNFSGLGHWNSDDEALMNTQLEALLEKTQRLGISLFVVMLPRHPGNLVLDQTLPMDAFDASLQTALGTTPFLDLQTLLDERYFADDVHVTREGAHLVTAEIVRFIESRGGLPQ